MSRKSSRRASRKSSRRGSRSTSKSRRISVGKVKKVRKVVRKVKKVKKTTGSYLAREKLKSRDRKYKTHDNGGRPFLVKINHESIRIYLKDKSAEWDGKEEVVYPKLVLKVTDFLGYWSGYDSSNYAMHGNSLLIRITGNQYLYVGERIYSFKTQDLILDYVSPVGNSDVPYPVAFGSENVYFMLDRVGIPRAELKTPITVSDAENLYGEFYGYYPEPVYPQGMKMGTPKAHKYRMSFRNRVHKHIISVSQKMLELKMIHERTTG